MSGLKSKDEVKRGGSVCGCVSVKLGEWLEGDGQGLLKM